MLISILLLKKFSKGLMSIRLIITCFISFQQVVVKQLSFLKLQEDILSSQVKKS
jgi:hypothetical protein